MRNESPYQCTYRYAGWVWQFCPALLLWLLATHGEYFLTSVNISPPVKGAAFHRHPGPFLLWEEPPTALNCEPDMLKFERKSFPYLERAFFNPLKNEPVSGLPSNSGKNFFWTAQKWAADYPELDCHRKFIPWRDVPYHDNIIYLPRGPLGRYVSRRTLCERGLVLMVTYSELFQFVIMLCAVITLVIHFTRKK